MAALNIPSEGERVGRYMRTVTFGTATASPDVTITTTGTQTVALANINEANVFVEKVEAQVIEALTSTVTITIGDGDDADGYWTDTLFLPASTAATFNVADTTVGYAAGKLYTSSDTIDIVATGANSAGLAKVRITYFRGADTDLAPDTST